MNFSRFQLLSNWKTQKKAQKNPIKPTGLGFYEKPGCFPTLLEVNFLTEEHDLQFIII